MVSLNKYWQHDKNKLGRLLRGTSVWTDEHVSPQHKCRIVVLVGYPLKKKNKKNCPCQYLGRSYFSQRMTKYRFVAKWDTLSCSCNYLHEFCAKMHVVITKWFSTHQFHMKQKETKFETRCYLNKIVSYQYFISAYAFYNKYEYILSSSSSLKEARRLLDILRCEN